ncbi:uncharacterized protein LOC119601438 [Lucilia sericata]|uniref:uncharacterized protein LOC119601438 n=1 Tax=Lucilia sericata TaxID=13632 RepID=UPI0018A7FDA9|nr:uncharacterized protein LOC119601438 [Lucilia sericata]
MPIQRTPPRSENVEVGDIIDMSETIKKPNTHEMKRTESVKVVSGQSSGAIPKVQNPQPPANYSMPPPPIPQLQRGISIGHSPRAYAGLIRELIIETNKEYRDEPGHVFKECPSMQRNLFCYKCGLNGVVTTTCPNCSENLQASVRKPVESRSTQTTTGDSKV